MSSELERQSRTRYRVQFPSAPDTPHYREVKIIQRSRALDVAVIPLGGEIDNLETLYASGAPVRVDWENAYGEGVFVGHVSHHEPDFDQRSPWTDVVCVGAAYPMLAKRQRVFESATADQVVRAVAAEHQLSSETDPHPRVYSSVVQPNISDWALLRRLAENTGYALRMEGTTVQFVNRARMDAHYRPRAQVFARKTSPTADLTRVSEVIKFKPLVGDLLPDRPTNTAKTVTHVNPITASALTLQQSPFGSSVSQSQFTTPTARVANDWTEASALVQAEAENNRFVYRATALLHGNPLVAPERLVYLSGVPNPYGGYWTVLAVRHRIEGAHRYFMDVELGSDGLYGDTGLVSGWDIDSVEQRLNTHPDSVLKTVVAEGTALGRAGWVSSVVSHA